MLFNQNLDCRKFDEKSWDEIYVVGDVHACYQELRTLISSMEISEDDLVLFVGDIVRKGPHSSKVVQYIDQKPNMHSIRGNNEEKVVSNYRVYDSCYRCSYDGRASLPVDVCESVRNMPYAFVVGSNIIVHAGVSPNKPLYENSPEDLIHSKKPDEDPNSMWYRYYDGDYRILFGHKVHDDAIVQDNYVALDTGAVYGGELTAIRLDDDELFTVDSVEYESRDDDKVVMTDSDYSSFYGSL